MRGMVGRRLRCRSASKRVSAFGWARNPESPLAAGIKVGWWPPRILNHKSTPRPGSHVRRWATRDIDGVGPIGLRFGVARWASGNFDHETIVRRCRLHVCRGLPGRLHDIVPALGHHVACREQEDNRGPSKSGQWEHLCLRSFEAATQAMPRPLLFKSKTLVGRKRGKDLINDVHEVTGTKTSSGGNLRAGSSSDSVPSDFLCFRRLSQAPDSGALPHHTPSAMGGRHVKANRKQEVHTPRSPHRRRLRGGVYTIATSEYLSTDG